MARMNLVDIDFNSFSNQEKKIAFITMDVVLKNKHENNKMVTSFEPKDIYYDQEKSFFDYDKVEDITSYLSDSKEEAILDNVVSLSTFAFCSYLKTYDPKDGLLNNAVIAKKFNEFTDIFDPEDVDYYKSILVDSYTTKKIPEVVYYSDYLMKKEKEKKDRGEANNMAYIKATDAGRFMTDKNEAAFTGQFALIVSVTATLIFVVGYILYILSLF